MAAGTTGDGVWQEPVRGDYPDPRVIGLSGRERLAQFGLRRSPAPPLFHLTGALPVRFGDGTADAEMPASGWLLNSAGLISGGTLAILADIAFGCAIETQLPAGVPYTTAELSLTFLRPARAGGVLECGGQAIHVGRAVALSEAFVYDRETEALLAHGTSRCAVLDPLNPIPEPPADLPEVEEPRDTSPDPYRRPPPAGGVLAQSVWDELPGAEILARQIRGELPPPPIHSLTGLTAADSADGEATFVLPSSQWLTSPLRMLQGGTIAMLADHAMLGAMQTTAPAGLAFAGLDLKVNYLRPVLPDGRDLTARAEIVHAGRTLTVTSCRVENADRKPVALATGSAMFLPGRPASLGEVELGSPESTG
jgi:uncharacterized protein (TIGR00369 family)